MAYRQHELAALIVVDRASARKRILAAFVDAKCSRDDAARILGCRRSTLLAWIKKLGLQGDLQDVEAIAKRDEWHHGRLGGAGWHRKKDSRES